MEERRGRPAAIIQEEKPRKFTRVYEDEYAIETWSFNNDQIGGPIGCSCHGPERTPDQPGVR